MKPSSPSFAAVPSSSLGRPRRVPSQTAPLAARRSTLDQETLLILVVLAFLLRCRADRELIWALLYILLF